MANSYAELPRIEAHEITMSQHVIFHIPWQIGATQSASQLRPHRMLDALRESNFHVHLVMGDARSRRRTFCSIRRQMRLGTNIAFCYSESSTQPTLLAEGKSRILAARLVDYRLFFLLRRRRIPLGLFLRDLYWRFPEFRRASGSAARHLYMRLAYLLDVVVYKLCVSVIFVPSLLMADHLPRLLRTKKVRALPPGAPLRDQVGRKPSCEPVGTHLRSVYIGGIGAHYRLHQLSTAAREFGRGFSCTICVRESDWQKVEHEYRRQLPDNVRVVHMSGNQIEDLYDNADFALLFVEPSTYWSFAMPFKLFEYLGHGLPVIATEGTAVGSFVRSNGAGWSIPYQASAFVDLVRRLIADPLEVTVASRRAMTTAGANSWVSRAREVSAHLANDQRRRA